jgi:uncharacterized protein
MKPSRFNIFFPYKGNIVAYNSIENDFIFLTNELYQLYSEAVAVDVKQINKKHPEFWQVLIDKKFIVPENIDEIEKIKDLVHSIDCAAEHYHLIINPTLNCTFKCWYCYETHVKGSKMDDATIEKIKRHIDSKLSSGVVKHFTISWFGGEPLLYYNQVVVPLLKFANKYTADKSIGFNSNFTSNGVLINDTMVESFNRLKIDGFQITLDGHREQHDKVRYFPNKKGSYDEIVSNIKKCLKSKVHINCRINISKDNFAGIHKILEDFSDVSIEDRKYFQFSFHTVWQEKNNFHTQILDLSERFKENNFVIQYNMHTDTVRNSCYADKEQQATINYNGDVFKCTALDFTAENREGLLKEDGTIEWNEKYYARMKAKFKNAPCLKCKILPICNGSCSQKAIDSKDVEYCIRDFDENKKIEIVRAKLESVLS